MKKYYNLLLIVVFVFLEVFFLVNPKVIISSFNTNTNICLYSLLPSMFISCLFSQILISLNIENYLPKLLKKSISKLFNISDKDVSIIILSMISGYPNNANLLKDNPNLNNIIHYTNFVNPIFLIATVGCIYLKDIKLSIIILLSHYISNFLLGIILRNNNNLNDNNSLNKTTSFLNIYYSAIRNTVISVSIIFANILFFSFVLSIVKYFISINPIFDSILYGSLEFSSGIYNITHLISNKFINGLIITIIITFSSFSIHMQIINLNKKIRYFKYLIYRFINVFISIIVFIILFNLLQ